MSGEPSGWSDAQRERSTLLLERLRTLAPDSPERAEARDELVLLHLPLVRYLARRFPAVQVPFEDAVQVGTIGLITAIDRFDHERGTTLSTYAAATVIGHIRHHIRDAKQAVRVPRSLQERSALIAQRTDDLTARLRRTPTVADLAADLGLSRDDVLEALDSYHAATDLPLDLDRVDADPGHAVFDERFEHVDDRHLLRPLLARLTETERRILALRFGHDLSQGQIAAQIGVSQMQVSRILARTLASLRAELASG